MQEVELSPCSGSENLPVTQEAQDQSLGQEDLLEKEKATRPSILV